MIEITKEAEKIMNEDAVQAYPDECCGFLFGTENNEDRLITAALPVYNSAIENKKRRFVIAPKDYLSAERFAEENNLQFLGIYHSHPDHPAIPSEHDRVAAQPWFSYIIISVSGETIKDTRSWLLNEDFQFDEEQIQNKLINSIK